MFAIAQFAACTSGWDFLKQDAVSMNYRALSFALMMVLILMRVHGEIVLGQDPRSPMPSRPNIVVILCDDLGHGDYSAFGTKDLRTPNIDRLCREGMTIRNFYANSCVCLPTRAALLTSCYPDRVGVPGVIREEEPDNSWGYLAPQATLLPQVLHEVGYHSAIIGKWHLGISPVAATETSSSLNHGKLTL